MTWGEFRELFIDKFFSTSARHAKAREFLELKQESMTVLEYVAKFTELARFGDDYVGTDLAKVRDYEYVFLDELPGLPPHRDVEFIIELHPGMSPISMTPHRMAPVELQELKVQL